VRRVKGTNVPGQLVTNEGGYGGRYGERVPYSYHDPDGTEAVEAWECVDGCPIKAMDEQSGQSAANWRKAKNGQDGGMVFSFNRAEDQARGPTDSGGASRFFQQFGPGVGAGFKYQAKASRAERNKGLEGMPESFRGTLQGNSTPRNPQDGKNRNGTAMSNGHPTVKPIALMRYLCRLITPPGGTVLDPFCGSGSTGCAAVQEGFNFMGIEKEPEYAEIARRRIAYWSGKRVSVDADSETLKAEVSLF
jgi:site-specific DNA-methyltransferase (adenine-specific)